MVLFYNLPSLILKVFEMNKFPLLVWMEDGYNCYCVMSMKCSDKICEFYCLFLGPFQSLNVGLTTCCLLNRLYFKKCRLRRQEYHTFSDN